MKILPADFDVNTATCILKFSAEWCGPCKAIIPTLEKVIENTGVHIYEVDIDTNPELTQQFGIRNVPTLIGFRDGTAVDVLVGSVSQDKYEALANLVLK